jgi:cellulose synthase/poly-beta-1,6-N-acetylglucosamine synthase-like glycosyltransferase
MALMALSAAGALLFYTYILYPLSVLVFERLRPRPVCRAEWEPRVSFIITAHNEERDIARKVDNTLALEYPRDRLEILVASDGSTDRTHSIVEGYAGRGVRLAATPRRVGKTAATQRAVGEAGGELLVFSDATGLYNPDALRHLCRAAADPEVGCVSGRVEYEYGDSLLSRGFRLYQRYEKALRRAESACGSLTSVSGSIHAVRRALFPSAQAHQNYDLLLPLALARRGLRAVYENEAVSMETARTRARDEFQARVRAAIRAFSYLGELRRFGWVLNYPFFVWAVVSHKILRWFTPLWLILLLCGHLFLAARGGVWLWSLVPHAGVYVLAGLGAALPPGRFTRWLAGPAFLGAACAGFLVGLVSFLRGTRAAAWESAR